MAKTSTDLTAAEHDEAEWYVLAADKALNDAIANGRLQPGNHENYFAAVEALNGKPMPQVIADTQIKMDALIADLKRKP